MKKHDDDRDDDRNILNAGDKVAEYWLHILHEAEEHALGPRKRKKVSKPVKRKVAKPDDDLTQEDLSGYHHEPWRW